ncbi:uncharacterized protein TNCV_2084771 [Trichonephila clavipes]|uniref:Uncharacterized protein n=1 Tax=Trichonephila clavipes TaxID=2585209 RepID=A0A8X6V5N7_TRICX|nr:uncharacterized protein TNCV_2084771 [Trichonephila clavipes]
MPSIGGYHPYGLASILTELESNRECVGYAWPTNCSPSTPSHLSTGTSEALLDEWCNFPQDQIDNLILSMPRRSKRLHDTGSVADRKRSGRAFIMSGRCGDRFTKKSIEKIVRLHKHHYKMHILAESDERYARLQQDGAICHTLRDSMEVLTEFFDDRVISKGLMPTRLPDLSTQDFFSFGISEKCHF